MSLEISSENQQFLDASVASGKFPSQDAVINRAVSLLRERRELLDRLCREADALPELPPVLIRLENGNVMVRGRRISLYLILDRFFAGAADVEIQEQFPSISLDQVQEVLAFARANLETMQAYFDRQSTIEQLLYETGNRGPSFEELRARWQKQFGKPFVSSCQ